MVNSLKGGQLAFSEIHASSIQLLRKTLNDYLVEVFGLLSPGVQQHDKMDEVVQVLIQLRKEAKMKKDFATSDSIRNQLQEAGIQLKDEKDGTMSWTFIQ